MQVRLFPLELTALTRCLPRFVGQTLTTLESLQVQPSGSEPWPLACRAAFLSLLLLSEPANGTS